MATGVSGGFLQKRFEQVLRELEHIDVYVNYHIRCEMPNIDTKPKDVQLYLKDKHLSAIIKNAKDVSRTYVKSIEYPAEKNLAWDRLANALGKVLPAWHYHKELAQDIVNPSSELLLLRKQEESESAWAAELRGA